MVIIIDFISSLLIGLTLCLTFILVTYFTHDKTPLTHRRTELKTASCYTLPHLSYVFGNVGPPSVNLFQNHRMHYVFKYTYI